MKNQLTWTQQETFEGVNEVWTAEGLMYALEVQEQDNGVVVGTIWRTVPATRWEPEDVDCVLEREYPSVSKAKKSLEKIDADECKAEQESEKLLYESFKN